MSTDRAALRTLAHPLRSRLLAELRVHGGATGTELATALGIDLVVVGPEAPLVAGVVDVLADAGDVAPRPWGTRPESSPGEPWSGSTPPGPARAGVRPRAGRPSGPRRG